MAPRLLSLLVLAAWLAPAQNLPFPRRKKTTVVTKEQQERLRVIEGTLRRNDPDLIVLEPKDRRLLRIHATPTTKFVADDGLPKKASDFRPGDEVAIDFYQDDDQNMYAAKVMQVREGTPAQREAASAPLNDGRDRMDETEKRADEGPPVFRRSGAPPPAPTSPAPAAQSPGPREEAAGEAAGPTTTVYVPAEDPDKPRLRRGPPPVRRPAAPDPPAAPGPVMVAEVRRPPAPPPEPDPDATPRGPAPPDAGKIMDPIDRARAAHAHLDTTLPNYTALQITTRYESESVKVNWQAKDTITADLFYGNGTEQYRNVKLNGKPSKGKAEEGNWSIGEFATVVNDIFRSTRDDSFYLLRKEVFNGRDATLHSFRVDQQDSNWLLKFTTQSYRPAYRGRLWLDRETGRVLRVEMQAQGLPEDFPLDVAELSSEAEFVRLGTQTYLLPVRSEVLTCFRGTHRCSRNTIEYRNYKKFGAESTITFETK